MCGGKDNNENDDSAEPVKYDPTFNGPIKNRSCTDIICCLLFIVFFLGFLGVGAFAYTRGDPTLLLYPTDSSGNLCGTGDFDDRPYLLFFDLLECGKAGISVLTMGCPTPQVCVDKCPDTYWAWLTQQLAEEIPPDYDKSGRKNMVCVYDVDPETSSDDVKTLVEDDSCAPYLLESEPLVGRCMPKVISDIIDGVGNLVVNSTELQDKYGNAVNGTALEESTKYLALFLNAKEYGMKVYQDVRASWWMILVGLGISMLLAFIWIVLMRWIAGVMVWFTIFCFIGIFGFATYYCTVRYLDLKDLDTANTEFIVTTELDYYWNLTYTWLAFACIAGIILLITLLVLLFLRKRILIAIQLVKESSKAVGHMIFTLFWPIFPFIFQVILFTYWGASALYLASFGQKDWSALNKTMVNTSDGVKEVVEEVIGQIDCETGNTTAGAVCQFVKYGSDEYTIYLQFYQLFMLFWVANFIVALGQMTLAGSFASYYWAFNKPSDIPAFPVSAALWRCFRYHLGTLAFGSLLIAIIQIIRVMLEYLDHKLKGSENKVAKFFLKCMKCCFWCLEKFMKFLNKNAYILTAVYGYNFCKAAATAFSLILRNVVRVVVVDKVADFIVFIGKLVVTGAVVTLAYFFFSGDLVTAIPIESISDYIVAYTPSLNYYLIPVIIIGLGSFVIASGFFNVYSMGVDTLFLCFLEDLERHDGSAEKPYYMSKGLMKILGKKNTKPPTDNGESKKEKSK